MKKVLVFLLVSILAACFAQQNQESSQNNFIAESNQVSYYEDIMTNWLQYVSGTVQDWFNANEGRNLNVEFWNSGLETVPSTKKEQIEKIELPKSTETKKENNQEKKERNWNTNINWDLLGYSVIDIATFIQTGQFPVTERQQKDDQNKKSRNWNNLGNNPFNVHVAPIGLQVVILDPEGDLLYDTNNTIVAVENLNRSPEVIRAIATDQYSYASRPYSNFVSHHLAKVFRSSTRPSYHITVRITLNQFISGLPYVFFEQFEGTVYWQNTEPISFYMGNLVVYDPPIARTGYRYFRFLFPKAIPDSLCRTDRVVYGQQYRLSFWINICDCQPATTFTVLINGVDQFPANNLIVSSSCVNNNCTGYKKISVVWTATSSSSRICFTGSFPSSQVNLDDILFEQI